MIVMRRVALSCALLFSSTSIGQGKTSLGVDSLLTCRAEVGYVLVFRLRNLGQSSVELPEDLLPWSPGAFAMTYHLKPDDQPAIPPAGIVADNWGRVVLEPQEQMLGAIRLSLLFPPEQTDKALKASDARLQWEYRVVLSGDRPPPVRGEHKLLGGKFLEKCKDGLPF